MLYFVGEVTWEDARGCRGGANLNELILGERESFIQLQQVKRL